jgi:hypothetical protein
MKGIWHKYKIWLLIGVFYAAYWVAKGFKIVKQIDMHKIETFVKRPFLSNFRVRLKS